MTNDFSDSSSSGNPDRITFCPGNDIPGTYSKGGRMTEQELGREVEKLADEHNVFWHHCTDSRRCNGTPGLVDYILLGKRHMLMVELKVWGELRPGQRKWRDRLMGIDTDLWELWTPQDLRSGHVEEIMAWL